MWLGLLLAAITAILVFVIGKRQVFVEAELAAGIVAVLIFQFLSIGLYKGARFRKGEKLTAGNVDLGMDRLDWSNLPDVGNFDLGIDGDEGCLGVIVGLLISVFAAIVIAAVLWFLMVLGLSIAVVIFAAVYWVFHLALRTVFARSRKCRGNVALSIRTAMLCTFFYTSWIFVLLAIGRWMLEQHGS